MFGTRDVAISPVAATAFVTLADVKEFLGESGSAHDTLLTALVLVASQTIEAWCGTIFTQRTVTEAMFPEDSVTNLMLSKSPVIALTSLTIDDVVQTNGDFRVMKDLGALRRVDGSEIGGNTMIAVYTAGYATLPEPVVHATKLFVRDLFNSRDTEAHIAAEAVPDVGSVTYKRTLDSIPGQGGVAVPLEVAALIGPYSRSFAI